MLALPEKQRSLHAVRDALAMLDYHEVINYSFVDAAWERDLGGNADPVQLLNPIASQMSVMRSQLVGGLLANVRHNINRKLARGCGSSKWAGRSGNPGVRGRAAGCAAASSSRRGSVARPIGPALDGTVGRSRRASVDFYDVKG